MNLILAVVGCWYHGKTVCVLDLEKMESRLILLAWARYPNVTALFIGSGKVENKSLSDLTCAGTILGNEGDMYC